MCDMLIAKLFSFYSKVCFLLCCLLYLEIRYPATYVNAALPHLTIPHTLCRIQMNKK